jgi:hypothetical protein
MKYAAKMGSGAMLYIASFIKTGSDIQKLMGGDTQTHRQQGDLMSSLLFFQNTESRLKTGIFVTVFPWFPTNPVSMDMETENYKHLENQTVAWELKYGYRDNTTEQRNCKT